MPVILNETKQAEDILKYGEVGTKPISTLFLLGKYYRQKMSLSKEQTEKELNTFMVRNYKNYNPSQWESVIEDIAKKALKYPLKEIDTVGITQNEFEKIRETSNIKYQKLLFTMLCHAKYYNAVSESNNNWVNTDIQELYSVSRVSVKSKNDKFLYLNDLERMGFISFSNKNDNLNIRVNFVDEDAEAVLLVSDFRELGYEYLNYLHDGRFIKCANCGRFVRITKRKDFSTKYCLECAKKIKNEQNKRYYFQNLGKAIAQKSP